MIDAKGHKLTHPKTPAITEYRSHGFFCNIRSNARAEGNLNINSLSGCHRQCPHHIEDNLDGLLGTYHYQLSRKGNNEKLRSAQ